jgi:glycosyltransferase involved in cell wall biosynthesis
VNRSANAGARPRHCMVVYSYYPLGEPRVQREAEALVDSGYAVDVICPQAQGQPTRDTYRGVHILRLPPGVTKRSLARQFLGYVGFMVRAGARLTRLHLRRGYDTVQIHNLPDFLVFSALVPKLQRVPVILDLHDLMPEFFEGRFGSNGRSIASRLIRWQESLACRFADHVITVSDHWRDVLIERGVSKDKISVVMNVADERIFKPRAKKRTGSEFRLIYHGTVTYRYGLDLAVRAVALLKDEIPNLRLTVVGQGDLMPELFDLRRALGLEDHVELRDELVLAEELPALLERADVGVVPYRDDVFTDGLLPTKLMEYAAVGIPSVCARTTAIESYFHDAMVEFFSPGDADDLADRIRKLYLEPEHLERLTRRSVNFVRRHNWADVGSRYVHLVRGLSARDVAAGR